jgi:hypothetical protein
VAAVLFLLLAWSTAVVRSGQITVFRSPVRVVEATKAIDEALAQSEAALLFGGDDIAAARLSEAKALVAELPARSRSDREQKSAYEEKIRRLEQRVSRVTVITAPKTILDLATLNRRLQPAQLYLTAKQLVTADPQSGLVARVARTDAKDHDVWQNQLDTGRIKTGAVAINDRLIFSTDRQSFVEVNIATGNWKPLDGRFPKAGPNIQSLAYFQNRIYALDIANNAIVRFALASNSLGAGANWLRVEADVRSARAAVVDGSVYVLQPGGRVELYFNGRPADLRLAAITPPLTDATRVYTNVDAKNLYLLDPAGRRVVVFSKQGGFIQQYQSPAWTHLRDVVADEAAKTLYLINGTTIQSVPLVTS